MTKGKSSRRKLVPESHAALDRMKYEIAAALELPIVFPLEDMSAEFSNELGAGYPTSREGYWGNVSSRDTGAVGGAITRKLIQQATLDL